MKTTFIFSSISSRFILCALLIGVSTSQAQTGRAQESSMSGTTPINNIENKDDRNPCESCDSIKISFQSRLEAAQLSLSDLSQKNQVLGVQLAQAEDKLTKSEEQQNRLVLELDSTKNDFSDLEGKLNNKIAQLSKDLDQKTCEDCEPIKLSFQTQLEAAQTSISDLSGKNQILQIDLAQAQSDLANSGQQQEKLTMELETAKHDVSDVHEEMKLMSEQFEAVKLQRDNEEYILKEMNELDLNLKKCQSELIESEMNYNEHVKKADTLETSMNRLRKQKDTEIKSLETKISQLSRDLDQETSQLKVIRDNSHDLRRELSASHSELRRMQTETTAHYCNITYMKSDAKFFAETKFKQALKVASVTYHKNAAPVVRTVKKELSFISEGFMKDMEPHFSSGEKAYRLHVEPRIQTAKSTMVDLYNKYGKSLLDEALVATRLTFASGLQVFSRNSVAYVKTLKEEEMKQENKIYSRRNGAKKTRKSSSKIPYDDIISGLAAVERKSEDIVDEFFRLSVKLVLAVIFLRIFKVPVRALLTVVMLPIRMILGAFWVCLLPVRVLGGWKRM